MPAGKIHTFSRVALVIAASLAVSRTHADAVTQGQQRAAEAIKAAESGNYTAAADQFAQA